MNMMFLKAAAAVSLAFSFSAAYAQQPSISEERKQAALERLQAADVNQDGFIDKAEADASLPRVGKNFDKLDTNRDGKLSQDEFRAMAARLANRSR
jgi:Ca2+-binding EF-hand superfamily protein